MSLGNRLVFSFSIAALTVASLPPCARSQGTGKNELIRIAYPIMGMTLLPLRLAQTQGFFQQERFDAEE